MIIPGLGLGKYQLRGLGQLIVHQLLHFVARTPVTHR